MLQVLTEPSFKEFHFILSKLTTYRLNVIQYYNWFVGLVKIPALIQMVCYTFIHSGPNAGFFWWFGSVSRLRPDQWFPPVVVLYISCRDCDRKAS